jgi:predicted ATPase
MNRWVVLSGCSGGGKSSLAAELGRRGYGVVEEPGRRVIAEEEQGDGRALPWHDMKAFLLRVIAMAREDLERARAAQDGWVFFDRGLIDALVALGNIEGEPTVGAFADGPLHYHHRVFLVPPWPGIFVQDEGTQARSCVRDAGVFASACRIPGSRLRDDRASEDECRPTGRPCSGMPGDRTRVMFAAMASFASDR